MYTMSELTLIFQQPKKMDVTFLAPFSGQRQRGLIFCNRFLSSPEKETPYTFSFPLHLCLYLLHHTYIKLYY